MRIYEERVASTNIYGNIYSSVTFQFSKNRQIYKLNYEMRISILKINDLNRSCHRVRYSDARNDLPQNLILLLLNVSKSAGVIALLVRIPIFSTSLFQNDAEFIIKI